MPHRSRRLGLKEEDDKTGKDKTSLLLAWLYERAWASYYLPHSFSYGGISPAAATLGQWVVHAFFIFIPLSTICAFLLIFFACLVRL
jgi:hypothetical protein